MSINAQESYDGLASTMSQVPFQAQPPKDVATVAILNSFPDRCDLDVQLTTASCVVFWIWKVTFDLASTMSQVPSQVQPRRDLATVAILNKFLDQCDLDIYPNTASCIVLWMSKGKEPPLLFDAWPCGSWKVRLVQHFSMFNVSTALSSSGVSVGNWGPRVGNTYMVVAKKRSNRLMSNQTLANQALAVWPEFLILIYCRVQFQLSRQYAPAE